jgi:hypothetical protein
VPGQITYKSYALMGSSVTPLGDLPISGSVAWSKRPNAAGTFSGAINLSDKRISQRLDILDATAEGKVLLIVDIDGAVEWPGIITSRPYDSSNPVLPIQANEVGWYFTQRVQAQDYSTNPATNRDGSAVTYWTAATADPMAVAAQLVLDAILTPGSAFGTGTPFPLAINVNGGSPTPSGAWITPSYPYSSLQKVDQVLSTLSQMGFTVGFDYGYDVGYSSAGVPMITLNLSYPRRGRIAGSTGLVIDQTRARKYTFPTDAGPMATTLFETASGASALQVMQANPMPIAAGYPLTEDTVSWTNVSSLAVLQNLAQGDSALRSYPQALPTVTLDAFADPAIGSYSIGDDVLWRIPADYRFPKGMEFYWRIAGIDVAVPDEGEPAVALTLNLPPSLTATPPPLS